MMKPRVMGQFYEREFEDSEKNQRDLSNSRKGPTMKKLTHRHIESVGHGKLFLNKAFSTNPEPRFKREIESDIERLGEVEKMLLHILYNPGLPFNADTLVEDMDVLRKEHNDGPANASR